MYVPRRMSAQAIASVLVEIGYMSNKTEEALMRSKGQRVKVSTGIRRAIDKYFAWHEQMSRS